MGGGLSCKNFCLLYCWPPCPGMITAQLGFSPPSSSYEIYQDDQLVWHMKSSPHSKKKFDDHDTSTFETFLARTRKRNSIVCLFIRVAPRTRYTILLSHENGMDLGELRERFINLGNKLECNILTYDYTGFGCSTGHPSEKCSYADIDVAWYALKKRYGLRRQNVILYGQSIGSGPTVYLATKVQFAGVILHSPIMSLLRVAFPGMTRTYCTDIFPNVDRIHKVLSPTLFIHGTKDEVVDFYHATTLYKHCPKAVEPLWIKGADHDNIMEHSAYFSRVQDFINGLYR